MNPDDIKKLPIVPHDQTSNQLWVDIELDDPANAELIRQAARDLKGQGWLHIYTRVVREPWHTTLAFMYTELTTDG